MPSDRPAILSAAEQITATHGNGDRYFGEGDDTVLVYTPEAGYRGPASITFEVTDGSNADDPEGNVATLTLAFTVGSPDDVAPTFTTPNLVVTGR